MLPENDRYRDFLGVTRFHKAGYKGKRGLAASGEDFINSTDEHAKETYKIFKEFAPDSDVIYMPPAGSFGSLKETDFIEKSIPTILDRKVDVMWASLSLPSDGSVYDEPMEKTAPFFSYFMSVGNTDTFVNNVIKGKHIYGVGAYRLMVDGRTVAPEPFSLASNYIDFSIPDMIWIPTDNGLSSYPFSGSSAVPVLAAMARLVNDFFIDKTGKPLSDTMMYQFMKDHARDIYKTGKDTKTGWGAPILPDPADIDIERYAGKMLNSRNIDDLRADVAANCHKFVELCKAAGYPVLVTGTVRDDDYQALCYYKGTGGKPPATFHNIKAGLAFDCCKNVKGHEYDDEAFWAGIGAIGEKMGFSWGKYFKRVDKPHFQWSEHGKYTDANIRNGIYPPEMPLYEEDEDMTQEQFNTMYNEVNPVYETINDVPAYWQEETKTLIDSGKIKGDGTGKLNIRQETLRAIIVGAR